jgi:type I restriction enzyme, S subunit
VQLKEGYKQTEAGVIPKDWNAKPLKGKISIAHGFPFASKHFTSHGQFRLTTPGHFHEEGGFRDIGEKQKFYDGPVINDYVLRPGEMIVAMTEQADGLLGSAALIPKVDGYLHNQRLGRVRALSADIDLAYLFYVFNSPNYRSKVRQTAAGTKVKHTSPEKLLKIDIPFPSPSEQRAIAEVLSDVDRLLEALKVLIAKKRAIKHGAMQQLLTGKTRLPGFSGEWTTNRLKDVTDCLDTLRVPLNETQRAQMRGRYPYCGANGVLDYVNSFVLDDEVILIAEDGGYFDEYAHRPIAYRMSGRIWVNNHAHILKAKPGYSQGFLYFSLVHKNLLPYLASGTRAKLNRSEMNKIEVLLPKEEVEQAAIAAVLSDVDAEIAALEARRDKTRAIKQGMMQQLLTGRTRLVKPQPAEAEA